MRFKFLVEMRSMVSRSRIAASSGQSAAFSIGTQNVSSTINMSAASSLVFNPSNQTLSVSNITVSSTDGAPTAGSVTAMLLDSSHHTLASQTVGIGAANLNLTVPGNTPVGTYTLITAYSGGTDSGYTWSGSSTTGFVQITQATPTINWPGPADIYTVTPLSSTQLNATSTFAGVTVQGTYAYAPDMGTRSEEHT